MLAGKSGEVPAEEMNIKRERGSITVMALLDGGTNSRQKSWLKVNTQFSPLSSYIWTFCFLHFAMGILSFKHCQVLSPNRQEYGVKQTKSVYHLSSILNL
jgi:hypothetical protein